MKLTIEIPNERTAEVLRFLAALMPASQEIAADPLKVAMDDPVEAEDPTRRELPWGDLPEPPPLPEGKTRWVNRGEFPADKAIPTRNRIVWALRPLSRTWFRTLSFSTAVPHIEAI